MTNYSLKPTDENALGLLKTDPIGRNKYIRRFIQMLTRMEDDCYTVALNGDWGSGKTFFVKQIKMILDAYNTQQDSVPLYSNVMGTLPVQTPMQRYIMTLGHSITMTTQFFLWYTQHLKAGVEKNRKAKRTRLLRLR